ncbi:hypothetical protein V8E51_006976 [Hyaloscypha variabilis]
MDMIRIRVLRVIELIIAILHLLLLHALKFDHNFLIQIHISRISPPPLRKLMKVEGQVASLVKLMEQNTGSIEMPVAIGVRNPLLILLSRDHSCSPKRCLYLLDCHV